MDRVHELRLKLKKAGISGSVYKWECNCGCEWVCASHPYLGAES